MIFKQLVCFDIVSTHEDLDTNLLFFLPGQIFVLGLWQAHMCKNVRMGNNALTWQFPRMFLNIHM